MTDYRYDRAYKYVEAGSVDQLVQRIEDAIQEMASQEDVTHLEILSVSHDIFTQPMGGHIFSAFITCILVSDGGGPTVDLPSLREDDVGSAEAPGVGNMPTK